MYYIFFMLLGLSFGSFGNVLISRVPSGESIGGRSMCPFCKNVLSPVELIPVASYLLQNGQCKHCRSTIGVWYPVTELLSAIVFVLAAMMHSDLWIASFLALALWLLLVISIIDLRTRTISDGLNIPFIVTGIAYSVAIDRFSVTGMLLAGAFFGALWLAGRGKWIGSGDVILGVGIGALVGSWEYAFASLMITYIFGALIVCSLLISRIITRQHYVAFAPFLSLGAYAVLFMRPQVERLLWLYFGI